VLSERLQNADEGLRRKRLEGKGVWEADWAFHCKVPILLGLRVGGLLEWLIQFHQRLKAVSLFVSVKGERGERSQLGYDYCNYMSGEFL